MHRQQRELDKSVVLYRRSRILCTLAVGRLRGQNQRRLAKRNTERFESFHGGVALFVEQCPAVEQVK